MIKLFNEKWDAVPVLAIDTETTGIIPGQDAAVQVALVRFEGGAPVASASSLIDPGREIPITAITIHGITNEAVKDAPTLLQFFNQPATKELIAGAQPLAFNATFDRAFVPLQAWGEDWGWQWLDPLTFVRVVDRFVRGQGRHKLEAACARRGIEITKAHDAAADAEAAGRLFYRVVPETDWAKGDDHEPNSLGQLLAWQRHVESDEWYRFMEWLAAQPPREVRP